LPQSKDPAGNKSGVSIGLEHYRAFSDKFVYGGGFKGDWAAEDGSFGVGVYPAIKDREEIIKVYTGPFARFNSKYEDSNRWSWISGIDIHATKGVKKGIRWVKNRMADKEEVMPSPPPAPPVVSGSAPPVVMGDNMAFAVGSCPDGQCQLSSITAKTSVSADSLTTFDGGSSMGSQTTVNNYGYVSDH
jgi:hypothetical protein